MPYISFRILDLDTQPYFIIAGLILILVRWTNKVKLNILFLIGMSFSATVIGLTIDGIKTNILRNLITYIIPLIMIAAWSKIKIREIERHIITINIIWLIVGVLQIAIDKNLFSFLVEVRTSEGRGATSLSPEPTHYGIYLLFVSLIILKINNYKIVQKKKIILLITNIISIIFIAKSSMATLLSFLILLYWLILNYGNKLKLKYVLAGLLVIYSCWNFMQNTRINHLIELVHNESIMYVLSMDESINLRLKAIVHPILGLYENNLLPGGFSSYKEISNNLVNQGDSIFWTYSNSNKIMSGIFSAVYELSFFSIFLVLYIISELKKEKKIKIFLFELLSVMTIMSTAITIAFPLFSIFLIVKPNVR